MKFSLSWLKACLDTEANATQLAATLNAIGLEVEGVDDPAGKLVGFRVARVLGAAPHPDADKLQVLSIDIGDGVPLQVVCGAPNARAGLVGVLGLPGAVVPASGMALKVAAVRGVESHGMMCSGRELGLGDDHAGIIELPADAPVGAPFVDYHRADPVFDISVTPNRPDCMGVYGIARDLAAAGLGTLKPIDVAPFAGDFACPIAINIEDEAGCPAFHGRVIRGVTNGNSPEWLRARLQSAGQRPISAIVDITNYLMLTYGRPTHAYDLAKLAGPVVARRARAGEQVTALNGKDYALDESMTVIADAAGVHDIAGIMGGAHSGCSAATSDVLLEVAYFDPRRIAATGRKLNLTSDARSRFERGIDPGFLDTGLDLLTALIVKICGGEASQVVKAGQIPRAPPAIAYDPGLAQRLGGIEVSLVEQSRILKLLGFEFPSDAWESAHEDVKLETAEFMLKMATPWALSAPGWRPDIDGAADIVEEVVRIHGLDTIVSVPLPRHDGVAAPTATPAQRQERRLRRAAAARGLNEAITWSFLPVADAEAFAEGNGGLWLLTNPISEDMKAMRPSLLPGLLAATRRNLDRGAAGVRLFEIGRRYLRGAAGRSDERLTLAAVLAGEKTARGWATGKAEPFDAYDAKAEALALLAEAGAPVASLQVMGDAGSQFHPGQSGTLRLGPKMVLARFGMLHPGLLRRFGNDAPVAAAELFIDAVPARRGAAGFTRSPYAPPALQAITRDFAFLVSADLPAADLVRAARGADKANIVAARVFDDFRGAGVAAGYKSLAIEITLQPVDQSYDDAAIRAISERITVAVAKLGAVLRG